MYYVTVTDNNNCFVTDSIIITTTEVPQTTSNSSLSIFPNPTSGVFSIEKNIEGEQDIEVTIINSLGQVVYKEKLDKFSGVYRKTFDLDREARGIYQFEMITDKERIVQKLSLQ